ncbi:hypothetical protein [Pandoraea sputorum]|uniref:hypothetical protein n=1 Tax=Pandoraea sputorum TaxID=93222 RepID=UPI0012409E47|nr:hypothetical protein [Pandoraea sputorum]
MFTRIETEQAEPVQEFLKFRVFPDENVEFQAITLDPANFSIMQKKQYDCTIGKGVTFAS